MKLLMLFLNSTVLRGASVAIALGISSQAFGGVAVVDSNAPSPGDNFTNSTTSNTGAAVGSSGWYYNNVRNNGVVGINTNYPHAGNGSVSFATTQGPGGNSSKADLEFLPSATQDANGNWSPGAALGLLANLTSLSYDWYRDGTLPSTASVVDMPVLRLQVYDPVTGANGYLVYELEYNQAVPGTAAPTNTWVTENVFANDDKLWASGSTLPYSSNSANPHYYNAYTLSQWQDYDPAHLEVVGVNVGVGSGWGTFNGAVDNITFGFGGVSTTYNFETAAVPEPASFVVWGALVTVVVGCGLRRRNRS